jgi:RES domain-containing protein
VREARDGRHLRLVSPGEIPPTAERPAPVWRPVDDIWDRELARRLARIELASIDTAIWRHTSPREQSRPDSGQGAIGTGGLFNPPGSFPVVYGSMSRTAAGTEFRRLARRHPIGIENLLPRHLYRFRIKSGSALDLRLPHIRQALGLPQIGDAAIHRTRSQLIGEIARTLEIDVIIAPSSSGGHAVAAIFPDLITRPAWEYQHMEIWMRMSDVPGSTDLQSGPLDHRMTML